MSLHPAAPTPRRWLLALLAAGAGLLLLPSLAAARGAGVVYTQTNTAPVNEVVAYDRAANGTIRQIGRVATGGAGATSTPPFGFPITDSQGSVELTDDGRLLFVVNAGSDTISSFRVSPWGNLRLVDHSSSGGDLPISVDSHRGVLYVLNELSGTISGLRYDSRGRMRPILDSTESLSIPGAAGTSAQVGFDPTGRVLTVTLRTASATEPGRIDTFVLRDDDTPRAARANPTNAPTPFGFDYDQRDNLIVSNAGVIGSPMDPAAFGGSASSYSQARNGTLTPLDNVPSNGRATCWVVVTSDGRHAFMTNTLSHSVSRFRIDRRGELRLLGTTETTSDGAAADIALSRDSRYLYVLSALEPLSGPTSASIDVYRVRDNGNLTHIQSTPSNLPAGTSGLAAS